MVVLGTAAIERLVAQEIPGRYVFMAGNEIALRVIGRHNVMVADSALYEHVPARRRVRTRVVTKVSTSDDRLRKQLSRANWNGLGLPGRRVKDC
jgi:hypothetical protein